VNEFLTRANYGLNIGNFEMDFQDGEIRFKTAIDVEEVILRLSIFYVWGCYFIVIVC